MSSAGPGPSRSGTGPLVGLRVAVTRPADRAQSLVGPLQAAGATTRCFPLIRIVGPSDPQPLLEAAARLSAFDWVVFTSASGVAALANATEDPLGALARPRFAVVGEATADALMAAGRSPDIVADNSVAEGLAQALVMTGSMPGARVLWPRAAGARTVLADELRAAGAWVEAPEAYATAPDEEQARHLARALAEGGIDVLTFTSPSAIRSFSGAGGRVAAGVRVAAIGPVTAAAAEAEGYTVDVLPDNASAELLAEAIVKAFGKRS